MPSLWSPDDLATRFGPYIDELHDVFAMHGLHYGSPEDIQNMAACLESPGALNEEVASLVRSMVLREGGSVPRTDLLEILAIAIAGPRMDAAGEELQPSVRKLLSFLNTALRRPWNEPAGRQPEQAEDEMRAQAARELREAAARIEAEARSAPSAAVDGHVSPGEQDAQAAASQRANIIPFGRARAVFSRLAREDAAEPMEDAAEAAALEPALPAAEYPVQEKLNPSRTMDAAAANVAAASMTGSAASRTDSSARNLGPISAHDPLPEFDDEPPLPAAPRLTRSMLVCGLAAAMLALVVLGLAWHAGPAPRRIVAASQYLPPRSQQTAAATPQTSQAIAASSGKPSAGTPGPARSHFDDGYVAAPYSSMPPEQAPATQPANTMSSAASGAGTLAQGNNLSVPSNSVADNSVLHTLAPEEPPLHPRIPAAVMALNLIAAPRPDYPLLAKLAHVDGPVIIHAEIGRSGSVVDAEVISGHHLLRHAAEDAVRQWRYHPYQVDGKAVPVSTTITVRFRH